MRTIHKFEVTAQDVFTIQIPEQAKVLTVQEQHGTPMMWVELFTEHTKKDRRFRVVGTGNPIPQVEALEYIATFQLYNGSVWHLYEVME